MIRTSAVVALAAAVLLSMALPAAAARLSWKEADAMCAPKCAGIDDFGYPDMHGGALHCVAKTSLKAGTVLTAAMRRGFAKDTAHVTLVPLAKTQPAK